MPRPRVHTSDHRSQCLGIAGLGRSSARFPALSRICGPQHMLAVLKRRAVRHQFGSGLAAQPDCATMRSAAVLHRCGRPGSHNAPPHAGPTASYRSVSPGLHIVAAAVDDRLSGAQQFADGDELIAALLELRRRSGAAPPTYARRDRWRGKSRSSRGAHARATDFTIKGEVAPIQGSPADTSHWIAVSPRSATAAAILASHAP